MSLKPRFTRWILRQSGGVAPHGACCVEPGDCREQKLLSECDTLSGTWYEGKTCSEIIPDCDPVGSCCVEYPPGTFICWGVGGIGNVSVTESACDVANGTWTLNGTCPDDDCSDTGACCKLDFPHSCNNLHEYECAQLEGLHEYKGDGTNCGQLGICDPPAWACCYNGSCTTETEAECSGTWHENELCAEVDCWGDPCESVTIQCCAEGTEWLCDTTSGDYYCAGDDVVDCECNCNGLSCDDCLATTDCAGCEDFDSCNCECPPPGNCIEV